MVSSFANSKKGLVEKARRSIFATKRYLDFNKLPINTCNKLFDTLFLPILLYGSEIWGAYDNMHSKKNTFLASLEEHLIW